MSFTTTLRSAVLGALGLGCSGPYTPETSTERAAVFGGVASGEEDDAVVRFVGHQPSPYSDFLCNGVLLAPNVMLTALHCVAAFDNRYAFGCLRDGSLDTRYRGGTIGELLDPSGIDVLFGTAPSFTPDAHGAASFGSYSTSACLDDVAVVVLDTNLPSQGRAVRTRLPVTQGELMTVVGFGLNDLSQVTRARRAGVPVLDVGPDDVAAGVGSVPPRTFALAGGPCEGDDGAPAFSDETGAVTGVYASSFGGNCREPGTRASFSQVAPFERLLRDAFDVAGGAPVLEPAAGVEPVAHAEGCTFATNSAARECRTTIVMAAIALLLALRKRSSPRPRDGAVRQQFSCLRSREASDS